MEVVHGRERGELAGTKAMAPMMIERELAVATFDGGAAALEQIGTVGGDLLEVLARLGGQALQGMPGLAQRREQLRAERTHASARVGVRAARGDALQIEA